MATSDGDLGSLQARDRVSEIHDPRQIAGRHDVWVDQNEVADTYPRQLLDNDRATASDPDHGDPQPAQTGLPVLTEEEYLASVALRDPRTRSNRGGGEVAHPRPQYTQGSK